VKRSFSAPWSNNLKISTGIFVALMGCVPLIIQSSGSYFVLAILAGVALFSVIGYRVENGRVIIQRLGWTTALDLNDLVRVEILPFATAGSLRTFGIGGLFSYSGMFSNEQLGIYQSYVTNPENTVVLYFETRRTAVVSPDDPKTFAMAVDEEIWRLRKHITEG
jgi:hypothetical protein